MPSDKSGSEEDLTIKDADAENVVGGQMDSTAKKQKAKAHKSTSSVQAATGGSAATPSLTFHPGDENDNSEGTYYTPN